MAREKTRPLTPEEAKAKFLAAATLLGPAEFTRRHPWEGVSAAFLVGCLAGSEPGARRSVLDSVSLLLKIL